MNLETEKNNQNLDQKNSQVSQKIFDPNLPGDDLLSEFMEVDKDYTYKRQIAYLEYQKAFSKYLKPNFFTNYFMTFKENYLKFTHLVTKNAILATIIMLLGLSTVSASAAQVLAPNQYKPTTLINNLNKKEEQKETEIQPLVADQDNNVIVLKKCDLAIKFSKKVQRQTLFDLKPYAFDSSYYTKYLSPLEYVAFGGGEGSGPGARFSAECYDKIYSVESFSKEFVDLNKKGYFEAIEEFGKTKIEKLDKQEFCKQIGLTKASCQKDIQNTTKIQVPSSESSLVYYFMNYSNKTYLIEKGNFASNSNQKETLTIQFDSLAPSKSSIDIFQTPKIENSSSSSQKSQVSSTNQSTNFKLNGDCSSSYAEESRKQLKDCQLVNQENQVLATIPLCRSCGGAATKNTAELGKNENGKQYITEKADIEGSSYGKSLKIYEYDLNTKKLTEINKIIAYTCNMGENPELSQEQKQDLRKYVDLNNRYSKNETQLNYEKVVNECKKSSSNLQSYTNEFYPSLNIRYDDSWKMEAKTTPSMHKGLINREVVLSKNSSKLTFYVSPKVVTGCGGGEDEQSVAPAGKNYRFKFEGNPQNTYHYQTWSKGIQCHINYKIKSNLESQNYSDYKQYFQDDKKVESLVVPVLESSNPQEILEADQIIANSNFAD
jgi:hypothetical protein